MTNATSGARGLGECLAPTLANCRVAWRGLRKWRQ